MAETARYHDSKWYEAREAEWKASRWWIESQEWWCAKHPGACPYCGRRLSAHKKLGDCAAFQAEGYANDLGWDAGQRGHIKANPYRHDDLGEASLWKIYEDGYQEGAAFFAPA